MYSLQFVLIVITVNFISFSNSFQIEIFQIPNTKFVSINESVTISCRAQNVTTNSFMIKRNGAVMVLNCRLFSEEVVDIKCNQIDNWHYINLTFPKVAWNSRGSYDCINKEIVKKIFLNITVPSVTNMNLGQISFKKTSVPGHSNYKVERLPGSGTKEDAFKIISTEVNSVDIKCSSNWYYPPVPYRWNITNYLTDLSPDKNQFIPEARSTELMSNETESKGMYRVSSVFHLDCQKMKLSGLINVKCYNSDQKSNAPNLYFLCGEIYSKSGISPAVSKKITKITTGETVNIIIGCIIGMILLVTGIVLICRHRTKDDLDRYAMRQNSIEHPGYRV